MNASVRVVNEAVEIRLRAERKMGEIIKRAPKNPGTRDRWRRRLFGR